MDSETKFGDLGLGALIRALDPSLDALEIADVEGNIVYVNGSWSRLFEWVGQDVAGFAWDLVRADGAEYIDVKNSWKTCVEQGTSKGTFFVSLPDGAEKAVSYTRTLFRDSNGVSFAVVTIYRPVSETAIVREPSQLLLSLLERRRDGVAVLDEDGSVIATNGHFAELLGYAGKRTTGLTIDALMPGVEEINSQLREGVVWWRGDVSVARHDGSSISTWMSMDTVRDTRGRVVGFVVRTNSSPYQEIQGQENADLPTDPLNRLVHDMRNVFTAIESSLYMALRLDGDQVMKQRLAAIQEASRRGTELLEAVQS